jgi:hypothetical protein
MKDHNPLRLREIWLIMFLLGIIMINYPFIHIFNKEYSVLGYPLLFLYFMVGWPTSILVVHMFSRTMKEDGDSDDDDDDMEKG